MYGKNYPDGSPRGSQPSYCPDPFHSPPEPVEGDSPVSARFEWAAASEHVEGACDAGDVIGNLRRERDALREERDAIGSELVAARESNDELTRSLSALREGLEGVLCWVEVSKGKGDRIPSFGREVALAQTAARLRSLLSDDPAP